MKKLLLTMLAVVFSTAIFAQLHQADLGQKMNFSQRQNVFSTQLAPTAIEMYASGQKSAPKYSPASGLYFYKPSGSMFLTWDLAGQGYREAMLALPALRLCTYLNGSNNPTSTRWYLDDVDYTDTNADSNGNLLISYYPVPVGDLNEDNEKFYYYPCPTLWNSAHTESYILPTYYSDVYPAITMPFAEMEWLAFVEDINSYAGLGALDNYNMCGTGTYTLTNGLKCRGAAVYQNFPKPTAPLFVEEMYVEGVSITGTPLKNGATLDLNIYDAETNELLGTFTATADDWTSWEQLNRVGTMVEVGSLAFRRIVQGLIGDENEPITIDRATHVELVGFNNDDVDFGPCLAEVNESDTNDFQSSEDYAAQQIVADDNGDLYYSYYYMDNAMTIPCPLILNIGFYSMMDYVMVVDGLTWNDDGSDETGYSILQIGTTYDDNHTYGKEGTNHDLGWLYVITECPWVDSETGSENYYPDEMPDWISGIYYDDYYYDTDYLTYVTFTAEALPDGVTGRVASFRLKGRGYTDDTYVVVVQGDGDPTGIVNIPAAAASSSSAKGTYNIAGQRVTESAKGILVRDGKKFIAK